MRPLYLSIGATALAVSLPLATATAQIVQLQNGTATFSQTQSATFSPDQVYDGDFGNLNGWAIETGTGTHSETAVWETAADLGLGTLRFALYQRHSPGPHLLGRFRFSVTADDRSTFADGMDTGGDVDAAWTVLTNPAVELPAGMTHTILPDGSILTGGSVPDTGTYVVTYPLGVPAVTGVRLEALEHESLPDRGPGHSGNGNFLIIEMSVEGPLWPTHVPPTPRGGPRLSVFPTPSRGNSAVHWATPNSADVRLTVLDATGREVRSLIREVKDAGEYIAAWDGRDGKGRMVSQGVYFVELRLWAHGRWAILTEKVPLLR